MRYTKIYGIRVDLSELESILSKRDIDVIMKEGDENKIEVYSKNSLKIKEGIKYISKVTSLNANIFITKILSKKNLTNNFKYKL